MLKKKQMVQLMKAALMHFYKIDLDKVYGYHLTLTSFHYEHDGYYERLRCGLYQLRSHPSGQLFLDVTFMNDESEKGFETRTLYFRAADVVPFIAGGGC